MFDRSFLPFKETPFQRCCSSRPVMKSQASRIARPRHGRLFHDRSGLMRIRRKHFSLQVLDMS